MESRVYSRMQNERRGKDYTLPYREKISHPQFGAALGAETYGASVDIKRSDINRACNDDPATWLIVSDDIIISAHNFTLLPRNSRTGQIYVE